MAFPIFAFFVAEGCRYTRSREKYLLRLGLFLADTVQCDYSGFGVLLIFLIYLARTRKTQIAVLAAGVAFLYGLGSGLNRTIGYIEDHLTGEIQYGALVRLACCSAYHCQRMFAIEKRDAFRIVGVSAPLDPDLEVYLNPDPDDAKYEVWVPVVKKDGENRS